MYWINSREVLKRKCKVILYIYIVKDKSHNYMPPFHTYRLFIHNINLQLNNKRMMNTDSSNYKFIQQTFGYLYYLLD